MARISCYWCPECMKHLACLLMGFGEKQDEEERERLTNKIAEHKKVCSKRIVDYTPGMLGDRAE